MRKGSALLIVLGMAAFMVVSAVSFSIYMRESRVPSSHLRRQVTSRYLLKAALANAIDRIDGTFASERDIESNPTGNERADIGGAEGVCDDPYPGIGPGGLSGNCWERRVFMPFGPVGEANTVPTLTLESLAYLPPAIVNEVRIASRKTRTAVWRNLSYEFGRYAFCAVDVSDCFDINRLSAGNRRTSAAGERISMGSLFRRMNGEVDDAKASEFDAILDRAGDLPFISMADFNIVAKGTSFAPFCRLIGSSGMDFYGGEVTAVSNALFITDTWFPETNRTANVKLYNLASVQPFEGESYSDETTKDNVWEERNAFSRDLIKNIGVIGYLALYDYLDGNSRPISFCVPTTETVPMVTGIGLDNIQDVRTELGKIGDELKGPYKNSTGGQNDKVVYMRTAQLYGLLSMAEEVKLTGTAMFPFRRTVDKKYKTNGFSADALMKVWWAPSAVSGRLEVDTPLYPTKDDWNSGGPKIKDGIVTVCSAIDTFQLNAVDNPTQEKAFIDFIGSLDFSDVGDIPAFWHITEWEERTQNGSTTTQNKREYLTLDGVKKSTANNDKVFVPYTANGLEPVGYWKGAPAVANGPRMQGERVVPEELNAVGAGATLDGTEYVMHLAVWVRIKDSSGQVVDLVPARLADDELYDLGQAETLGDSLVECVGGGAPILEFRGKQVVKMNVQDITEAAENASTPNWDYSAILCNDPRYNWAPENWFACKEIGTGKSVTGAKWLSHVGNQLLGKTDGQGNVRDSDIFMFTSDQEMLQSIGELQFLPYVGWRGGGPLETYSAELLGDRMNGQPVCERTAAGQGPCAELFWQTYSAFDGKDPLYGQMTGENGLFEVVSGRGDFRLNPLSPDERIVAAALFDTPYDYYIAATNRSSNPNGKLDVTTMNAREARNHAFNEKTAAAKVTNEEMAALAHALRDRFREGAMNGNFNWENLFSTSGWWMSGSGDDQDRLFGVKLDNPLYGVDRKFLYSYWRECFQNRQQLFLVFLRAEPLTVGGSSGDMLSNTQLGARGVALVWRDPLPPAEVRKSRNDLAGIDAWRGNGNAGPRPHRTRVLFFHPFD